MIVIMNDVRVPPPYTPESCTGTTPQLTGMIKKQVCNLMLSRSDQFLNSIGSMDIRPCQFIFIYLFNAKVASCTLATHNYGMDIKR